MITVVASSAQGSQSLDFVIDLQAGATLPVDVPLFAEAVDSEDSVATLNFSWHLLRKPAGSSASLDISNSATPTLLQVDTWGDYRLFCIASNPTSGETSEADPVKAPNNAFVQVRVRSENLGLVKPAGGERDWFTYAYEWVDAIEAFDPVIDDHEERITVIEARLLADTFAALSDTTFTNLIDGQVAIYNETDDVWENGTISTGASSMLLADDSANVTLSLATERLGLKGGSNVTVTSTAVTGGYDFEIGLTTDVTLTGNLEAATITATDELNVTNSLNASDIYVSGKVHDASSPYAYLIGKTTGWYMSDDGQASSECKLLTVCDEPTTSTRGGVLLTSDKWNGYNSSAKIPSVHIIHYSQQAEHSIYTNDVTDHPQVDAYDDTINANQSGATQVTPHEHILFHNSSGADISIEEISLVVMAGGDVQGQPYIWELTMYLSLSDLLTQTRVLTGTTLSLAQNAPWSPAAAELQANNILTVPQGGYFGFRCTQSAKVEGYRVIANVTAIRMI
jgi:hypothetical protein